MRKAWQLGVGRSLHESARGPIPLAPVHLDSRADPALALPVQNPPRSLRSVCAPFLSAPCDCLRPQRRLRLQPSFLLLLPSLPRPLSSVEASLLLTLSLFVRLPLPMLCILGQPACEGRVRCSSLHLGCCTGGSASATALSSRGDGFTAQGCVCVFL